MKRRKSRDELRSEGRAPTFDAPPLEVLIRRPARLCYELFCDAPRMPEWMPILRSASIRSLYPNGRPRDVAFLATLRRATVGYTLTYTYRDADFSVAWCPRPEAGISIGGWACFHPINNHDCVLICDLWLDLGGALTTWDDPLFENHATLAVAHRFREFALRETRAVSQEVTQRRVVWASTFGYRPATETT